MGVKYLWSIVEPACKEKPVVGNISNQEISLFLNFFLFYEKMTYHNVPLYLLDLGRTIWKTTGH
jgi:hypothetical protein